MSWWCNEPGITLQWRHNGRGGVSNHQPRHCLFNRLFRGRSKKTSKLCVTGLCAGNSGIHRWPVNSPHKGQVTRKCFYLMTSSRTGVVLKLFSRNIPPSTSTKSVRQQQLLWWPDFIVNPFTIFISRIYIFLLNYFRFVCFYILSNVYFVCVCENDTK